MVSKSKWLVGSSKIIKSGSSINTFAIATLNDGGKQPNAKEIMLPIGKTGKTVSLFDFSKLSANEYEKLANAKLGFFNKIAYKIAMKKLRKSIAADGTITDKKLRKLLKNKAKSLK